MKRTPADVDRILAQISFLDRTFTTQWITDDAFTIQIHYEEPDVVTGKLATQHGRRWYLDSEASVDDIVETAFKAARTSMEHVVGEHFLFCGQRIHSPHLALDGLLLIAKRTMQGLPATSREDEMTDASTLVAKLRGRAWHGQRVRELARQHVAREHLLVAAAPDVVANLPAQLERLDVRCLNNRSGRRFFTNVHDKGVSVAFQIEIQLGDWIVVDFFGYRSVYMSSAFKMAFVEYDT